MRIGRVTVTGGFVLLWGSMVYLDAGQVAFLCLLAAFLHEAGHFAATALCGGRIASLELNVSGAVIRLKPGYGMSYAREWMCVLAGPLVSLAAALIFSLLGDTIAFSPEGTVPYELAGLCLIQGTFNLLPARGLDGGRLLRLALESRAFPYTEQVTLAVTLLSMWLASVLCAFAFIKGGYGPVVLMTGAFAVFAMCGSDDSGNERVLCGKRSRRC